MSKEQQWAERISLGGLFVIHWIVPQLDLLEDFLHTWESTKGGHIRAIFCGENITIKLVLIAQQFGVNVEGTIDAVNALVKEAQVALKNIAGLDAFVNKEQWNVIWMEYHAKFVAIL